MTCKWECGDTEPEHNHYRVLVFRDKALLGGLTSDDEVTHDLRFAMVMSKAYAEVLAGTKPPKESEIYYRASLTQE